jgi:undecaprenyl diphosphate synthase
MDGNNRWSKKNSLSFTEGYWNGANKLLSISKYIFKEYNVNYISAFALSKNNLSRPKKILNSIKSVLDKSLDDLDDHNLEFDIQFIGDFNFLSDTIKKRIFEINKRKKFKKKLIIFLNYSGKDEIINASKYANSDKKSFEKKLFTNNLPDPDILIRSGGFSRLSNFMLYQLAFTELFFSKKLWPEIQTYDIKKIISKYNIIDRKFGL